MQCNSNLLLDLIVKIELKHIVHFTNMVADSQISCLVLQLLTFSSVIFLLHSCHLIEAQ